MTVSALETFRKLGTIVSLGANLPLANVEYSMTTTVLPARVNISDHVLFQEIEGECVLLNMASEQYFGLDDVGTRVWQLLVEDGDPAKALTQLRQVYDVDEATLRTDLAQLLEKMNSQGLVSLET